MIALRCEFRPQKFSQSEDFLPGLAAQAPQLAANIARPLQKLKFGRHACRALCIGSQIAHVLLAVAAKPQFKNNPARRSDFRVDAPLPAECVPIGLRQLQLMQLT